MKKLIKAMHTKKGFTLVECVIAIAVFAALTGMVLMIMSQTIQLSKKSSDAETDLNTLVQNVVQDGSKKTYGDDSRKLQMTITDHSGSSTNDFIMTYTTVDGYKNFIICPDCGEKANNLDYMGYIYNTSTYANANAMDKNFKVCYWYDITNSETNELRCPYCYNADDDTGIITPSELRLYCLSCSECDTSDSKTSAGVYKFVFNKFSGGYTCSACGNGNVVQAVETSPGVYEPFTKVYASDDGLMVSGMAANAIRYGNVDQIPDAKVPGLMKAEEINSHNHVAFNTYWRYTPNKNVSVPGIYTLDLKLDPFDENDTATVIIYLPKKYVPTKCIGTLADGTGDAPLATFRAINDLEYGEITMLSISGFKNNHRQTTVKFQLTNIENNNSFEEDYINDGGLMKYWFKLSQELKPEGSCNIQYGPDGSRNTSWVKTDD